MEKAQFICLTIFDDNYEMPDKSNEKPRIDISKIKGIEGQAAYLIPVVTG